jgi:methyl-accepting chemotaxis protein
VQIATAAEEQHQVAEEINQHIAQIHKNAQEVEALAQHSQADAASLRDLSAELSGHVRRFKY